MSEPICKDVTVKLVGADGNAFNILALVRSAMIKQAVPQSVIDEFTTEAMSGDYDHLLATCMRYVNVE